jgi:hypothetical protein
VSKPLLPAPKWAMPTDIPFGSDTMIESVIDDLSKKGDVGAPARSAEIPV